MGQTIQNFHDAKIDIGCIQECRSKGKGDFEENGFDCYYSGSCEGDPAGQAGVMICVKKSPHIEVLDYPKQISPRMMYLDLSVHGLPVRFFSIYAPQNGRPDEEKDAFWKKLSDEMDSIPKKFQYCLNGDYNATTTAVRCRITKFHGQEIENVVSNDNGHRLIRFVAEHQLHVASTYFKHKPRHSFTHYGNNNYKKIIDLCLNNDFMQKACMDSRVRFSYDFGSDHKLVVSRFKIDKKISRKDRQPKVQTKKRCDYKAVTATQKQEFLAVIDAGNYENEKEIMQTLENASAHLPKISKNAKHSYPWNDDEILVALLAERKEHNTNNNKYLYRQVTKIIRLRVSILRNEHYASEADKFNDAASRRQVEKCYTIAKEQKTTRRKAVSQKAIPGLKQHFETHFTHPPPTATPLILQQPRPQPRVQIPYETGAPTSIEILDIIRKSKNNKSSLDFPVDILKIAQESSTFVENLTKFYEKIWQNAIVPAYLAESIIKAIWKNKGSRADPSTWRGIMLSSILTKILACIFISRIRVAYNLNMGPGQMGFRDGKGCQDGNYCLKLIHQWCRKQQREVFVGMIDLTAAFDWVSRDFTWESVRHIIGDSILISIFEDMYSKTTCYMKEDPSDRFKTTCGVRQGGTESPYAYNCLAQRCLDTFDALCDLHEKITDFSIPFKIPAEASLTGQTLTGETLLSYLAYCDDIAIFAWSAEELEIKLNILWDCFTEFGLYMNLSKTETLIFNWKLGQIPQKIPFILPPESICTITKPMLNKKTGIIEETSIKVKNSLKFKYLGSYSQINDSSIGNEELENRITAGVCKFYELKKFFTNYKIDVKTRVKFLNSLVRTRMTYLCAGWTITEAQMNRLQSSYIRFLRYLVKGGRERTGTIEYTRRNGTIGTYSKPKMTSERVLEITGAQTLNDFIIKQQENWIGHCIRADDGDYIKRLTFPAYFKNEPKKRGKMSSTYQQVQKRFESKNMTETEMITSLLERK